MQPAKIAEDHTMGSVKAERLWAASGAMAVVLFACGLLFGDLLGSSNYPPLNATLQRLRDYFLHNAPEVRALSFFHALSALALLSFACTSTDGCGRFNPPGCFPSARWRAV